MPESVISVQGLGKRYTLRHSNAQRYQKLSDTLIHAAKAPLRLFQTRNQELRTKNQSEDFWALRDVSFEVQPGEVLGIIGRNGAGKSTLLKLLSRITEPTMGRITLHGRVASLLEVGTGFHPELTGRENIYLNGAILGMKRTEIATRFDEIVAFAEIEKFLDTPVKRYSSGMYVRLAFAVAAHLEPEILIVDEVLAVGDAAFQSRCLGKMKEVASNSGRTVFFVSHNLSAIRQLTTRCLTLEGGRVVNDATPEEAIAGYLSTVRADTSGDDVSKLPRRFDVTGEARFTALRIHQAASLLPAGDDLRLTAEVESREAIADVRVSLTLSTQEGLPVGSGFGAEAMSLVCGRQSMQVRVPTQLLAQGHFHCTIALSRSLAGTSQVIDAVTDVLPFEVVAGSASSTWHRDWGAVKLPALEVTVSA